MLANLQFLRFAAALLVVLFHSAPYLTARGHDLGPVYTLGLYSGFGGVDVFFVISGFIMAWTTPGASGYRDALDFLKRRGARIFAGYWPFFLLYLGLLTLLDSPRLDNIDLLSSLLLWPTPLDQLLIMISWTLIFELFFYVLFALSIALLGDTRQRIMLPLLAATSAGFLFYGLVLDAYTPQRLAQMSVYENYWAFPFVLQFMAGAALGDHLRARPTGPGMSLTVAGIVLWLVTTYLNASVFNGQLTSGDNVLWRVVLFGLPALCLVGGLARLDLSGKRLLAGASMTLGGASYAIYLSHPAILLIAQEFGLSAALAAKPALLAQLGYLLVAVVVIGFSIVNYRWIERPLQRLLQRVLRVRRRA